MTSSADVVGPWDSQHFRTVLGHFCSGITVIAAQADGVPVGLTCQSFFSVSIDPPLVAFSVARTSTSYPRIRDIGSCTINVLASDQQAISNSFAKSGTDKWSGVSWTPGVSTGHPIIADSLAWLECDIESEQVVGDHLLIVAKVRDLHYREGAEPLLYFRGAYAGVFSPSA